MIAIATNFALGSDVSFRGKAEAGGRVARDQRERV